MAPINNANDDEIVANLWLIFSINFLLRYARTQIQNAHTHTHTHCRMKKLGLCGVQNELNMFQHFCVEQLSARRTRALARTLNFQVDDETRMLPVAYLIHEAKMSVCVFVQKRCLGKLCGK